MKALVISGGGSKGAFAGGIAEYLLNVEKKKYDIFIGTSTGSLLVPLLAIGAVDKLRSIFTSVSQNDIFSSSPFKVVPKNGSYKVGLNQISMIKMFLEGKKSFGETKNLRKLISKFITPSDFNNIVKSHPEVIVTVSNLTFNQVEYKSIKDCTYDDFCDWMWASASFVPFMSLIEKNGCQYADGGFADYIPIHAAIKKGATEIDAIVLRPKEEIVVNEPIKNPFELTARVISFMLTQISQDNIDIARLEGINKHVNINYYYPPYKLTDHSFIFEPKEMKGWWNFGYTFASENKPVTEYIQSDQD